jgi:hypothetical protein
MLLITSATILTGTNVRREPGVIGYISQKSAR